MKKVLRISLNICAALYAVILIWIIVFKSSVNLTDQLFFYTNRSLNLIPHFTLFDAVMNILAFIPVGIYAAFIIKKNQLAPILTAAGLSLSFEIAQYILACGASDISDLITNSVGGLIGVVAVRLMERIFHKRIVTIAKVALCALTLALAAYYLHAQISTIIYLQNF